MTTRLEQLQEAIHREWECPSTRRTHHSGPFIPPIDGAKAKCPECLIQLVAMIAEMAGIQIPGSTPSPKGTQDDYVTLRGKAVPEQMRVHATELGKRIGSALPEGVGFMLMLFQFHTHYKEYISNGEPKDMIRVMREMADSMESGDMGTPNNSPVQPQEDP